MFSKLKQFVPRTPRDIAQVVMFVLMIILLIKVTTNKSTPSDGVVLPKAKDVEHRIESKETEIHHYTERIADDKKIIAAFEREVEKIRLSLSLVKHERDTFQIVQLQDTLINVLTAENSQLKVVVATQDSLILAQRYIINSKDTLLMIADNRFRKVRKQRNWSLVANGVLGGALIYSVAK